MSNIPRTYKDDIIDKLKSELANKDKEIDELEEKLKDMTEYAAEKREYLLSEIERGAKQRVEIEELKKELEVCAGQRDYYYKDQIVKHETITKLREGLEETLEQYEFLLIAQLKLIGTTIEKEKAELPTYFKAKPRE